MPHVFLLETVSKSELEFVNSLKATWEVALMAVKQGQLRFVAPRAGLLGSQSRSVWELFQFSRFERKPHAHHFEEWLP